MNYSRLGLAAPGGRNRRHQSKDCLTMQTKVSTEGQVVLPGPLRRRLDIRAGDPLDVNIADGSIVLTPRKKRTHRARLVTDPVTGLPTLSAGPNAPTLSSKEVEEILANFP
jgi:AbrB family looped-hinge helix DNA binding protein